MTAELLRCAAKVLREHVESVVIHGPWEYRDERNDPDMYPWCVHAPESRCSVGTGFVPGTAQYIALMHPPVALAVADWLDAAADAGDADCGNGGLLAELDDDQTAQGAVAVARAVLREQP
jgi:hypothetical protein